MRTVRRFGLLAIGDIMSKQFPDPDDSFIEDFTRFRLMPEDNELLIDRTRRAMFAPRLRQSRLPALRGLWEGASWITE